MRILNKLAIAVLKLFLGVLFSWPAFARVDLWIWKPTPKSATMLLPRVNSESFLDSRHRYLSEFNSRPGLVKVNNGPLNLPPGEHRLFVPKAKGLTAFIKANDKEDMSEAPEDVLNFVNPLAERGLTSFLLPMNMELGLSASDKTELQYFLAREPDLQIGLGGDDLDPALMGQTNHDGLSRNVSLDRDASEAEFWKIVLREQKSFVVAVCRTQQFIMSLMGYHLVRDLESQLSISGHEGKVFHPITVRKRSLLDPVFEEMRSGRVFSNHHQGFFNIRDDGNILPVAVDEHGIFEAGVFKNGMGLALQFHPELMPEIRKSFFDLLKAKAEEMGRKKSDVSPKNFELKKSICEKTLD